MLAGLDALLSFLGATAPTMEYCRTYALLWLLGVPAVVGKELLIYFIRIDGAPGLSFSISAAGGIANILLDALFVGVWDLGVFGAGLATVMGLLLSCLLGIGRLLGRRSALRITWQRPQLTAAVQYGMNGSSELVNQLAIAVTTIVFNRTALDLAGEDAIAAVSIIMYLQFIFLGVYFGGSMGLSPLLGYAMGQGRPDLCRKLEQYAHRFFLTAPVVLCGLALVCAPGSSPPLFSKQPCLWAGHPGNAALQPGIPVCGAEYLYIHPLVLLRTWPPGSGHHRAALLRTAAGIAGSFAAILGAGRHVAGIPRRGIGDAGRHAFLFQTVHDPYCLPLPKRPCCRKSKPCRAALWMKFSSHHMVIVIK